MDAHVVREEQLYTPPNTQGGVIKKESLEVWAELSQTKVADKA